MKCCDVAFFQAALGDGRKEKGNDLIPLRMTINGEKFVVGSLSGEKFPQIAFDLVFEKEFELSHDWKNGSVYFCGYSADNLPYPSHLFLIMFTFICLQLILILLLISLSPIFGECDMSALAPTWDLR